MDGVSGIRMHLSRTSRNEVILRTEYRATGVKGEAKTCQEARVSLTTRQPDLKQNTVSATATCQGAQVDKSIKGNDDMAVHLANTMAR